jgi:phosphomevalonate kinase
MEAVSEAVDQLLVAWRMKDHERILNALRRNVTCLRELTRISGISIETEDLRKLSDLSEQAGAVGKLSGAGGGDCGIAVCFDDAQAEIIRGSWKEAGIVPLNVGLERDGVKVVKRALESVGGANATVP